MRAQLDYLRSDERLRERAARAAEMSAEERLALAFELCRQAARWQECARPEAPHRLGPVPERPEPGAWAVLRRLGRTPSDG
jgi:hypothetical protein